MAKVGFKKRVEILLKTNRFVQKLYSFFGSTFFRFVGLFIKQDKKLILFNSFSGDLINDSPLALYNYISKNYPDYKCVWAVNDPKKGEGYNYTGHRWIWTGEGLTTRHASNHLQNRKINEPYVILNDVTMDIDELMYPCDPSGGPSNTYICYCEEEFI